MRWIAVVAGLAAVVLAFASATRVSDTREGLIAEIVTLLGGLVGMSLLIYGLAARKRPGARKPTTTRPHQPPPRPRSRNDALLGTGGIALAALLVVGLVFSGGLLWAVLGLALLLPMIAGSVYLCLRYLRSHP